METSSHETDYDLVVVGAGPGGSNAAAVALANGLRVAQIERCSLPRTKPCAGGMTVRATRSLQLDLAPSVRCSHENVEFNLWGRRRNRFSFDGGMLTMVLRPELDESLVRQNQRREGFRLFDGEAVRHLEHDGESFRVTTSNRKLRAAQLVGADGAYSIVAKRFGLTRPLGRAIAVEVILPHGETRLREPLHTSFDFDYLPQGYGWVFPKDDHHSVGLYTLASGLKDLRTRLAGYIEAKGFRVDGDPLRTFEAHQIPVGGHRMRAPELPVYLVGDAAGLADAFTGEGIYHALESGRIAGEVASRVASGSASPALYLSELRPRVLWDTRLSWHLARRFYKRPALAMRILELPLFWRPLVHGFGNGATLTECVTRALPFAWSSLRERSAARA